MTIQTSARFPLFPLLIAAGFALSGCLGSSSDSGPGPDDDNGDDDEPETEETYVVGGEATGLGDGTVTLELNGDEPLDIESDGAFEFSTELESGESYTVSIVSEPDDRNCALDNASGSVDDSDIGNVQLDCVSLHTVGGEASGIGDEPVSLELNGDETLDIESDGSFEFDTEVESGESYSVSITSEPDEQSCTLENETGTIDDDDVTDVSLECVDLHAVVGEVEDLGEDSLELTLESGEVVEQLEVEDSGPFEFSEPVEEGENWAVSVSKQPGDRFCEPNPSSGSVGDEDVEVSVGCEPGPELSAFSDFMQVHLEWSGPEHVDLKYSTDRDCDWDNYSQCDNSGMIPTTSEYEVNLKAVEEGLSVNDNHFVVAEHQHLRSEVKAVLPSQVRWDGRPSEIVETENEIIVGGRFEHAMIDTGASGILSSDQGKNISGAAWIEGTVKAATVDPNGGWFVGGDFDAAGGEDVENLARLHADGSVDHDWDGGVDDAVHALMVHDGRLYVGGEFDNASDGASSESRAHAAAFDAETGELDSDWDPAPDDEVADLEADGDRVFLGGNFSTVDGSGMDHVAAVDAIDGSLESSWDADVDSRVYALEANNDFLYMAGWINSVGGESRDRVAAVHIDDGDVVEDWDCSYSSQANALALSSERLYVGGFSGVYGCDAEDGDNVSWGNTVGSTVRVLMVHDGVLYAGGDFDSAGGGEDREFLAAFDEANGDLKDWDIVLDATVSDGILALAGHEDEILVGGDVDAVGGIEQNHLAALDPDYYTLVDWTPSLADGTQTRVEAMKVIDNQLYVAGIFETANGEARENFAAFDLDDGELQDWAPNPDSRVNTMDRDGDNLYIGGLFSEFDGSGTDGLVAVDIESRNRAWSVPLDYEDGAAEILSLYVFGDRLFAGGTFDEVASEPRTHVAALDAADGSVDTDMNPEIKADNYFIGVVHGVRATSDAVYVGGDFIEVGNEQEQENLAAFDADDGSPLTFPEAEGDFNRVYDLALDGDTLFAGGNYARVDGDLRRRVVAIDIEGPELLDWDPTPSQTVFDVGILGDYVVVMGTFDEISDRRLPTMMFYDRDTLETAW